MSRFVYRYRALSIPLCLAGLLLGSCKGDGDGDIERVEEPLAASCIPGTERACYSGPADTDGVGVCKAGAQVCNDEGTAFGPCVGEVIPSPENCRTEADEDCSGPAPDCGERLWSKVVGELPGGFISRVAADHLGNVLVFGSLEGTVSFGGEELTGGFDGGEMFLAKLDASGAHLWSKQFTPSVGGPLGEHAPSYGDIALDAEGNLVVTGYFHGTLNLGGDDLVCNHERDLFVAKFDAEGGHLWSKSFTSETSRLFASLAVGPSGDVVLAGGFDGTVSFGGAPLTRVDNGSYFRWEGFVAKLDADGNHVFSQNFYNEDGGIIVQIAVDPFDNILLAGELGGYPRGGDVFAAKLRSDGTPIWKKRFEADDDQYLDAFAVDRSGNLLLAGILNGDVDFGGGQLTATMPTMFVAKLDPEGNHVFSRSLGESLLAPSIGADSRGNVVLAGTFWSQVELGDDVLVNAATDNMLVAKFGPDGSHRWSRRVSDEKPQWSRSLAIDGRDHIVLSASLLPSRLITPSRFGPSNHLIWLAKLAP